MIDKIKKIDQDVMNKIVKIHTPLLNRIMIVATHAGTGAFIWWMTLCLPFVISKKYRYVGINLILALGVTFLLGEIIIKRMVGRTRPSEDIDDSDMLINKPKQYSFPSGHTASSFTAFSVTLLCCPYYIWLPVFFVACIISFSRLYLRVHFLSDIIAGCVFGFLSGFASVAVFERLFLKS